MVDQAALSVINIAHSGRFIPVIRTEAVQLPLSCDGDASNSLSAASIFDWTRRAANSASLVWVLPLLTASPISNRHRQMSGSSVGEIEYWMPLWITSVTLKQTGKHALRLAINPGDYGRGSGGAVIGQFGALARRIAVAAVADAEMSLRSTARGLRLSNRETAQLCPLRREPEGAREREQETRCGARLQTRCAYPWTKQVASFDRPSLRPACWPRDGR